MRRLLVAGMTALLLAPVLAQDEDDEAKPDPAALAAIASTAAPGKEAARGPAPNAVAPFAKKVYAATVKIYGAGGFTGIPAYGTGVLVDASGIIATSWSISLKRDSVTVVLDDGQRLEAKLVRVDTKRGLALLKIDHKIDNPPPLPVVELGDSEALRPGDQVYGIGNAFDDATGDEKCAVMQGVVMGIAALDLRIGIEDAPALGKVILTDVASNPGTQGGPLVTREGKLVGIVGRVIESKSTNSLVNFAIASATLRPLLEEVKAGKEPTPDPPIKKPAPVESGIRLLDAHLTRSPPAWVDRVVAGSPAEKAGVKPDDLVFRLDGHVVRTCRMFEDLLREHGPGEKVKLVVKRKNALLELELELVSRKEN